jgi:pyrroloquinoline quinone biosynthesis protein B
MIARILGSAAGGGFPQWNCNCGNCAAVRAGQPNVIARTQTSVAVSGDGASWVLLDATPDLRAQIAAAPALQPRRGFPLRSSPIKAVAVTGFEIDQVGGLLNLREEQQFHLHATAFVHASLRANEIFGVLAPPSVTRREMRLGETYAPYTGASIEITPHPVPGKVPLPHAGTSGATPRAGGTIGLVIRDTVTGTRLAYVPCCAAITDAVLEAISGVDVLLFDGTLYTDSELIEQGLADKTGAMMGHVAMSGAEGAIARLRDVAIGRRVFLHLNNSNPVLREDSRELRTVVENGWEVGRDGLELTL